MIRSVGANDARFKNVLFTKGANLVLADRSKSAGEKDTTNALGKSTLLEIIDFCLGADSAPSKGLRVEALAGWVFNLSLDIKGAVVTVARSVDDPSFIEVSGPSDTWPIQPTPNKDGVRGLKLKNWKTVLGWALFGLNDEVERSYSPSARSLLSYFVRMRPEAFNNPFKHFEQQQVGDIQIQNAFLLGLDWNKAAAWQALKDQTKALGALSKAIKTGAIDGETLTQGELEAERLTIQGQLERERDSLATFQVLPQYREILAMADSLTPRIHDLTNANITDQRKAQRYREITSSEAAPNVDRLESLYIEAGVALPNAVVKTLADARAFNEQIVVNRRAFIANEIGNLEKAIAQREGEIAELIAKRASYLQALAGQGALEELTALQQQHALTAIRLEDATRRIAALKQRTVRLDEIKIETVQLKQAATVDHEERRPIWSNAVSLFSQFSERLYNTPGKLVIDIADTGYKFDVEIAGSPSEGIGKMKVFCYDLALVCLAKQRGLGIDFLIHDSTIFDGVDPRQRAHAIELAEEMATQFGFQYICTLNTDVVPHQEFKAAFDITSKVRLRLTDTDPRGSLLGFRF